MTITSFLLKYYNKIPRSITVLFAPFFNHLPKRIKYGKTYRKEIKELERISKLSDDEIYEEKQVRLRRMITYAYEHVPYYRKKFDSLGLLPNDIQSEADLPKIPFLTKEEMVQKQSELISDEFRTADLVRLTTSGSTGNPICFYVQNDSSIRDFAYSNFLFRGFGFSEDSSKLVLRGKTFYDQKKGKNYQWDPFKRELSINLFDMSDDAMEEYCKAIERYKPEFAFGYMSAMYLLCKYLERRQKPIRHQFKGFFSMSEKITEDQREFVESVIGARVFSTYGMSERVIFGAENGKKGLYQIQQLYGVAELVTVDGMSISDPGEKGELVGTGLLNYGMPLIRYKTGDISEWDDKSHYYLRGIEGRWKHDVLISKSLFPITLTALNMHSEVFNKIDRYQLRQSEPGKAEILIVPGRDYRSQDGREIARQFNEKTKDEIDFRAIEVSVIKPGKNGKVKLVEQNLNVAAILNKT